VAARAAVTANRGSLRGVCGGYRHGDLGEKIAGFAKKSNTDTRELFIVLR